MNNEQIQAIHELYERNGKDALHDDDITALINTALHATPAASPATAAGTIDTPEFSDVLFRFAREAMPTETVIAYIDQHTAAAVAEQVEENERLSAYCERLRTERDALAQAVANAAIKAGIVWADTALTGPTLCMLADDMATAIAGRQAQAPVSGDCDSKVALIGYADLGRLELHIVDGVENGGYYLATDVRRLVALGTAAAPVSAAPTDLLELAAKEAEHWQTIGSNPSHKCGEYIAAAIRGLKAAQSAGAPVSEAEQAPAFANDGREPDWAAYEAAEREHLGDPDKGTGIYATPAGGQELPAPNPWNDNGALHIAIQEAARDLPEGYSILIDIERDAATISLMDARGEETDVEWGDGAHYAVRRATKQAIGRAAKQAGKEPS